MLVPHFIRKQFDKLHCCYVTLLEIGGSHAHRLRALIEHLGLITLIITDLDSVEGAGHHKAVPPARKQNQITRNSTLKTWHPVLQPIDDLLDVKAADKVKTYPAMPLFSVRVAYQVPVIVKMSAATGEVEALSTTFEDALVFENLQLFRTLPDHDGMTLFINAAKAATDPTDLSKALFEILKDLDKATFALDLLWLKEPNDLKVPRYIREGLVWLEAQLTKRQSDDSKAISTTAAAGVAA